MAKCSPFINDASPGLLALVGHPWQVKTSWTGLGLTSQAGLFFYFSAFPRPHNKRLPNRELISIKANGVKSIPDLAWNMIEAIRITLQKKTSELIIKTKMTRQIDYDRPLYVPFL